MPINHTTIKVPTKVVDTYTCNCCGKTTNVTEDPIEAQEYLVMDWHGGYGSVFGDGIKYELVLCQSCLKRHIGHYFMNVETGKYFNHE